MTRRRRFHPSLAPRAAFAVLGLTGALTIAADAHAGGFEIPDLGARSLGRGGAYAVGAADLTALHYNPGKLAALGGTRFLYTHNLVWHDTAFQRATLSDVWGDDAGTSFPLAENANKLFPLGAAAFLGSDFGLKNWMFAAGIYGPNSVGRHEYPDYGPQSFLLTKMDVLLIYYSLAVAWQLPKKFGVGITLQYVDLPSMQYALVADSTVTPGLNPIPDASSTQLITDLNMKDRVGFTSIIGLWGRPHRRVEIGAGGRVIPINMNPKGTVDTDKETLVSDDVTASMTFTLPVQLRGGLRYLHPLKGDPDRERFDIELDLFWENWGTLDAYYIDFEGAINGQPIQDQVIEKNWRDTFSVRLGGDVNLLDGHLTLRGGGFFETGASQPDYAHLDFPSYNRGGVGGGVTGSFRGVSLTVGFMHIFQQRQEVTEQFGKGFQIRPIAPCPERCGELSGVPANAGVFTSRFDTLGLSLGFHFNELIGKRKRGKRGEPEPAQPEPAPAPAQPTPVTAPAPVEPAPAEPASPADATAPTEASPADGAEVPEPGASTTSTETPQLARLAPRLSGLRL
ncbi:MAG: outer membrane protein transport protein [Myxococcales bacterium]|nr:outer membrane protein transport protein [Myxococcales bacterium]